MRHDTAKKQLRVLGRTRFVVAMCMAMVTIAWISNSVRTWGAVSTTLQLPKSDNSCLAVLGSYPCYAQSMAWGDWAACMQRHLESTGGQQTDLHRPGTAFRDFIVRCQAHLPWTQHSNYTAVLLEFRALELQMRFSIDNIMGNLPIHWRVQIVGGPSMSALASRLYAYEIAAQKVVVTSLTLDNLEQSRISEILTDKSGFYDKLKGDTWLFFQYDSAICSQQRDMLQSFLKHDYGWWGAPWDFWGRFPKMCGNGGFSLRKRAFIEYILARATWKDALSEDIYFCHAAADLYQELPPALRPAPLELEIPFSIETIWHEAPFAVHQFWPHLHVNTPAMATTLIGNCPEALGILPADLVANQTVWRDIVCAAKIDRYAFHGALGAAASSILRECPGEG